MYNPMTPSMTHGSGSGQGIGHCLDQYMRPPQAPPPHSMMGHRGMPPTEGESEYLLHLLNLTAATDLALKTPGRQSKKQKLPRFLLQERSAVNSRLSVLLTCKCVYYSEMWNCRKPAA